MRGKHASAETNCGRLPCPLVKQRSVSRSMDNGGCFKRQKPRAQIGLYLQSLLQIDGLDAALNDLATDFELLHGHPALTMPPPSPARPGQVQRADGG